MSKRKEKQNILRQAMKNQYIASDENQIKELKTQTTLFSKMKDIELENNSEIKGLHDTTKSLFSELVKKQELNNELVKKQIKFSERTERDNKAQLLDAQDDLKSKKSDETKIQTNPTNPTKEEKEKSGLSGFFGGKIFTGLSIRIRRLLKYLKLGGLIVGGLLAVFEVMSTMFDINKLKEFGDPSKMNWGEKLLAGFSNLVEFVSFGLVDNKMVYNLIHNLSKKFAHFLSKSVDRIDEWLGKTEIGKRFIQPIFRGGVKFVTGFGKFVGDLIGNGLSWVEKLWNSENKQSFLMDSLNTAIDNITTWFSDKFTTISRILSDVVWDIKKWLYETTGLDFFTNKDNVNIGRGFRDQYKQENLSQQEKILIAKDATDNGFIKEDFFGKQRHIEKPEALEQLSTEQLKAIYEYTPNLKYEDKKKLKAIIRKKERVQQKIVPKIPEKKVDQAIIQKQQEREIQKVTTNTYKEAIEKTIVKETPKIEKQEGNINTSNTKVNNTQTVVINTNNGSLYEKQFMRNRGN